MKFLAILIGKTIKKLTGILGKGTSLPGIWARKIDPNLLRKIQLPEKVIVVTGTNGKTTTSNMIAHILRYNGLDILHNQKGANLVSGILTTLIDACTLTGKINKAVAVLEIDESTVPRVFEYISPSHLVVTNFFRDQLDRYGELDTVISKISSALKKNLELILNGDDPLVAQLAVKNNFPHKFYGISDLKYTTSEMHQVREGRFCPLCNEKLNYAYFHYSQLGAYHCPSCDYKKPELTFDVTAVDLEKGTFEINHQYVFSINYQDLYFVFNAAAAISACSSIGLSMEQIIKALKDFRMDDGRMEPFFLGEKKALLNLVKNPTGLNQSLSHIISHEEKKAVLMILNNLDADGKDVSWIWDSDLEMIASTELSSFICSGLRAEDLAVRLKYAGVSEDKIIIHSEIKDALSALKYAEGKLFILSTYTALQFCRKILLSMEENKDAAKRRMALS